MCIIAIQNQDIVICKAVENLNEIRDNEIYAVKSNGALWIKHVQKILDMKGRVTGLKLISANNLEYDPFEEEVNEHTRLFRVIRRISAV